MVRAPPGGVISTSWNTPSTGSESTTNAGELLRVPAEQVGWQLFKVNVPLPSAVVPQVDQVTADIETWPSHPMSRVCGRTRAFDPGVHDMTLGGLAADGGGEAVLVGDGDPSEATEATEATDASVTTLPPEVAEPGELMVNPTKNPVPRAPKTAAATPSRTTTLR